MTGYPDYPSHRIEDEEPLGPQGRRVDILLGVLLGLGLVAFGMAMSWLVSR